MAPLAAGEKLPCVSYAPFRGEQTPLDLSTRIPAWQIEDDLAQLAAVTECVRTYSVNLGLDQITPIAQRHGLKVLQGLWLGRDPEFNRFQIETAVALANRYPDVIRAIVSNEVLLRGESSAVAALTDIIRKVNCGAGPGDLRRRVGILAAQPRRCISGRFCDHPSPAVLGGRSDPGARRRRPRGRDHAPGRGGFRGQGDHGRGVRLAKRWPDAPGRAAFADQPGTGGAGGARTGQAGRASG